MGEFRLYGKTGPSVGTGSLFPVAGRILTPLMRSDFWMLARGMLRYRLLLAGTVVMVFLASASLGTGLLGAKPIVDALFGSNRKNLQELAADANGWINANAPGGIAPHLTLSDSTISRLPSDWFVSVVWIMGALAILAVFGSLTNFLHQWLSLTVVNRTVTEIRRRCFHAVLRAPLSRAVMGGASDPVSRIVNDTNALSNGFTMLLSKAVLQVFKGVAALAVAVALDWHVTIAAATIAPLLYTVIRRLGKKIKRGAGRALESQADLYAVASESLRGLRVVKVNTAEQLAAGRFHRINKKVLRELNRVRTARALASPLTEMLSIFLLGGLVIVAAKAMQSGVVMPGNLMLSLMSLGVAGASLKPLTGIINDIQSSEPAANRVAELLRAEHEPGHDMKLPRLPRHAESIEFRNVTFTYPGSNGPAIRDASIKVPHGQRTAVVGPNGSGKTSLLALVPRLFDPDSGEVLIDGRDIRKFSVRSLRSQIGVVTQETVLFRGTIRENIAYGGDSVTDQRILDAARKARAHEFIQRLPLGYETPVAEEGLSLSGGQRQRIAIARAILRDPAILILDEATSMIDAESESHIAAAISEFSSGRTCLIVAHRLATVMNADMIVVMDAGRIADTGTHAELLGRCDVYQTLVRHQFGIGGSFNAS